MGRYNKYQTMQLNTHTQTLHALLWLVFGWVITKEDQPCLCIDYIGFFGEL